MKSCLAILLLLNELHIFGSLSFAHNKKAKDDNFASRSRKWIFTGYLFGKKRWYLFDLDTRDFFVSRDVTFHERIFPYIDHEAAIFVPPLLMKIFLMWRGSWIFIPLLLMIHLKITQRQILFLLLHTIRNPILLRRLPKPHKPTPQILAPSFPHTHRPKVPLLLLSLPLPN